MPISSILSTGNGSGDMLTVTNVGLRSESRQLAEIYTAYFARYGTISQLEISGLRTFTNNSVVFIS